MSTSTWVGSGRPGGLIMARASIYAAGLRLMLIGTAGASQAAFADEVNSFQDSALAKHSVDPVAGSLGSSVPIVVPAFRGLEPKLALSYRSGGGNGAAGVGWTIGFSFIELASPGRGAPRYDGGAISFADGHELAPCRTGSVSPSCTTGGTHSTKIENYHRIQYDAPANKWYFWTKDGTKLTYTPIYTTPGGTFRWGIATAI